MSESMMACSSETLSGSLTSPDVGVGHAYLFGLHPVEPARRFRPAEKRGTGPLAVRVGVIALGVVTGAAVRARAAADGRGNHHAVAHVVAELLDDADPFMAQDSAGFHPAEGAPDHMQVGAADGTRGQPHDSVGRILQRGFGNVV